MKKVGYDKNLSLACVVACSIGINSTIHCCREQSYAWPVIAGTVGLIGGRAYQIYLQKRQTQELSMVHVTKKSMQAGSLAKYLTRKADDLDGIVMRITPSDCSMAQAEALFHLIIAWKEENHKTIIAFIDGNCSAAEYLIATAADAIVCSSTTRIDLHAVDTAEQLFLADHILAQRKSTAYYQDPAWKNGKTVLGKEAVQIGLVDRLGGLKEVEQEMKKRTKKSSTIWYGLTRTVCHDLECA